ncbi:uncharacterized protein BJ212DRAFT_1487572 [Suillus subaureus]|uniref:Uncharacterized protein n=1 Tax=Suillus subaureus TaxID=48587 RepID=A0A9P7DSJ4_9AGAM|nr:uncharacterized protein BJ212DRAFT_1487572 [Suillus subaureus]KAG1801844.1 hypothetical protein BJ212DRAFT_1487572 [Suillus subaureus]
MPSTGGVSVTLLETSDDAIIGHIKVHVYNTILLSAVEQAFKGMEGDQEQVLIEILDVSSSESEKEKDVLKSLKAGLIKQVVDLGGKFANRPFPWILMPSSLTNDHLCIKGYPAHLSLMPGESHNINSWSKGVAGLTQHEVNVLAHLLKAKTMHIVKVTKTIGGAVIASKEPVIIGKAPPADSIFQNARRMFVNGTFDYGGPPCLQASSAITRKKKPKVPMSVHTHDDVMGIVAKDTMTTIQKTNLHPEVLIPPPSHPFKLAKQLPT